MRTLLLVGALAGAGGCGDPGPLGAGHSLPADPGCVTIAYDNGTGSNVCQPHPMPLAVTWCADGTATCELTDRGLQVVDATLSFPTDPGYGTVRCVRACQ